MIDWKAWENADPLEWWWPSPYVTYKDILDAPHRFPIGTILGFRNAPGLIQIVGYSPNGPGGGVLLRSSIAVPLRPDTRLVVLGADMNVE